ncbi:MAG: hypothetical protein V4485_04145 [Pseudomonadota bacterium]
MNNESNPNEEEVDIANAILIADECNQFIMDTYISASAVPLGYNALISTMPTKIDQSGFQRMLDLSTKVPEEYKSVAENVKEALGLLREIHTAYPEVEQYSLMSLTGEMLLHSSYLLEETEGDAEHRIR